jgi:hypothetical protein
MTTLHSWLRWIVLLSAAGAIAGYGIALARDHFGDLARRAGTVYAATLGLQFLIGLAVWGEQQRWEGGDAFRSWVHPALMIAAIGIASAGVARARRARNATIGLVTVIATVVIIVASIPTGSWPL